MRPAVLRYVIVDKEGNRLPPGPPICYAFLRKYAERALDAWAKQYGELFSIWMGSQLFVVISDPHVARDLLVINGAIFSTRKKYFMKNQIILNGRAITASEYGNKWYEWPHICLISNATLADIECNRRQHRRLAGIALNPKAMEEYASIMDYESHILIKSLFDEGLRGKLPINPAHFAGRFALK